MAFAFDAIMRTPLSPQTQELMENLIGHIDNRAAEEALLKDFDWETLHRNVQDLRRVEFCATPNPKGAEKAKYTAVADCFFRGLENYTKTFRDILSPTFEGRRSVIKDELEEFVFDVENSAPPSPDEIRSQFDLNTQVLHGVDLKLVKSHEEALSEIATDQD